MRASVSMAGEVFARLNRRIAEIEGRLVSVCPNGWRNESTGQGESRPHKADLAAGPDALRVGPVPERLLLSPRRGGALLSFGIAALDGLLGGGLRRNALHEVRSGTTQDSPAATGFAAALLARLAALDGRPILLVSAEDAAREGGALYGPGLGQFGLDPGHLLAVSVRRPEEALWVFEEGLRCTGLAAVLCEIRGRPKALDLTARRRLSLRTGASGVMGLLLRQSAAAEPGTAATRWLVSPRPAATLDDFGDGIGRPVWRLELERNRAGRTGVIDLEWDHGALAFALVDGPALSVAGAAVSVDRPDLAGAAGTVLAFRRTG